MNIAKVLPAILMAARELEAERVLICDADAVTSGEAVIISPCDDPMVDRVRLRTGDDDAAAPIFAIRAVTPGYAIFVAGGTAHFKDLREWMPRDPEMGSPERPHFVTGMSSAVQPDALAEREAALAGNF